MCCIKLSNWPVVDLPSRKPACGGVMWGSTAGASLPSNHLLNSVYGDTTTISVSSSLALTDLWVIAEASTLRSMAAPAANSGLKNV